MSMVLMMKGLIDRIFGPDPTVMTLGKVRASDRKLTIYCRDCSTLTVIDPKTLFYKDNMEINALERIFACPSCKFLNVGEDRTLSIEVKA
jgi:Zn finger protein HypA/HybF involved in hydrogenase expression